MNVAAVIVNYRTPHLVLRCLDALAVERAYFQGLKAVVVDNNSDDGSASFLSSALDDQKYTDWVQFLPLSLNGGFGWGNNEAILHLVKDKEPPDAILLINPDAVIEAGALVALVDDLQELSDAGAIGSQLLTENGTLSGSAFRYPSIAREFIRGLGFNSIGKLLGITPVLVPYGVRGPVDWVTGASVLIRVQALRDAGMFDTGFFLYFEEVELMHRFSLHGWKTYHCPESRVMHLAGASTGVVDGAARDGHGSPSYVFRSRQRYFALREGAGAALAADIAWVIGTLISFLIGIVIRKKKAPAVWADCKMLMRLGLGARLGDRIPAITWIDDEPGQKPAWLRS